MFARYTEDARKVVFFARYEASRLGSPVLQVEYLWLGLLRQNKRLMKRLAPQVTVEKIHARLARHGLNGERVSMTVEIPLSDELKRVLDAAAAEADAAKAIYVTSEYLVGALLAEENASAG